MIQLTPRKQSITNILINSAWALISWITWSIIIIILTFIISNYYNVVWLLSESNLWVKISPLFPFILSLITLLWVTINSFLSYHVINMTDPEKYKKNSVLFGQMSLLQIIIYILVIPVYIYVGTKNINNIMIVFSFHILLANFWTHLILEVFNNYRYILVGLYGTILWLVLSIWYTLFVFSSFSVSYSKMIILMSLLPISAFIFSLIKQIFELMYYYYYNFTWLDPIGDIFYQIELEEEENLKEEEEKYTI